MPNKVELENTTKKDSVEQTDEHAPVQKDVSVPQDVQEHVQPGKLSETDRSKLVEDPSLKTVPPPGRSRTSELVRRFEGQSMPAKPENAPASPGRSKTAELVRRFEGQPMPAKPGNAPAPPGRSKTAELMRRFEELSKPALPEKKDPEKEGTEKYALLKKDVSSLPKEDKEERAELLVSKYVTDWKIKKEEQMAELTDGLSDDEKTKEETRKSVDTPKQKSKTDEFFDAIENDDDDDAKPGKKSGKKSDDDDDDDAKPAKKSGKKSDDDDDDDAKPAKKSGKKSDDDDDDDAKPAKKSGKKSDDDDDDDAKPAKKSGKKSDDDDDDDDDAKPAKKSDDDDDKDKKGSTSNSGIGSEKGNRTLLSGIYGTIRSGAKARDKRKKGDSRGAALSRFDTASNAFGTATKGLEGGISGVEANDDASAGLGIASGATDMLGSGTNMVKGIYQNRAYGKLANRKETKLSESKMGYTHRKSMKRYKELKEAYHGGDKSARTKEKRMEMLKARHDQKRSKDFMETMSSAKANAKVKSGAGTGGAISAGIGLGGGILNTIASGLKLAGPGGMIASAILGGIGSLMKMGSKDIQKGTDAMEKKGRKAGNDASGKKYIDEKAASLVKKSDAQADHMTVEEARRIVALRLGVDDPSKYDEVYKKLSERRADRILNKEEGYEEVLAAMGLSKKADKATILEALGVS